ncbi:hypothetical protein O181_016249 [Austropuccinia psidii MF-1]|uniref:Retrotransposon gag domain-containing protein n=1 Tax=Austropuccinia psidii MF-1 TaxID=1389203 RepID=A0A9Q3C1B9_9BASI|nr:hypothetical protein [Austropuccinia psidii MF-1]
MPIQHSPPARQTRSRGRAQAVLTPTPRASLDRTQAVPQLRAQLDRDPLFGGFPGTSRTIFKGPGEDGEGEEDNSAEEENSYGTEGVPAPVGASQGIGGQILAQSDQPVSHQSEQSLLAIMHQMAQIMANLKAASSSDSSRPPAFKTPSMKAPECFDGTQPFKIEPYLSNLANQDPNYLLNSWKFIEFQLSTLFGDPNEVRKAEAELDSLRMEEGGHVSLYITDFQRLVSRIGDWGERALIHHLREGLPSRILDLLASHPSRIDSILELMNVTLELDTKYHERQK